MDDDGEVQLVEELDGRHFVLVEIDLALVGGVGVARPVTHLQKGEDCVSYEEDQCDNATDEVKSAAVFDLPSEVRNRQHRAKSLNKALRCHTIIRATETTAFLLRGVRSSTGTSAHI